MWTWQSVIKGFAVGIACRVAIKVLNYIADLGVILVAVPFGILSCLPEAQSQDAFCVRPEHNFIHQNPACAFSVDSTFSRGDRQPACLRGDNVHHFLATNEAGIGVGLLSDSTTRRRDQALTRGGDPCHCD